ncbi:hypothetical protein PUNSTDRAFT_145686 [Punctularia strigosozonata HHB-11173 SS5]|uniref:uncharacterized protein n=1 Tax=Punctularia strigosozonata (strain HHB-11173) TaxID=741275 RepID=UPI000441804E|nr:uncharacterized protein PUNSTDRAFT_145686 [Punctularia strigosozonata HHB-11173 SS5]EIN05750.1 hypothetical protein PUNSTDRAFT_145686 [Punctularia strigosozonata HHB-11173 SS5]
MVKSFWIASIALLTTATLFNLLVAIGLPSLPALDVVRVHSSGTIPTDSQNGVPIKELRMGTWGICVYEAPNGHRICSPAHHAYIVPFFGPKNLEIVGKSWTRGLAVHPVAAGASFIALVLAAAFSTHVTAMLAASLTALLAALLTLIAFAIDIALFAFTHHQVGKVKDVHANVDAGPGFWLTLVALILLFGAAATVIFGRRAENNTRYPSSGGGGKNPFSSLWARLTRY